MRLLISLISQQDFNYNIINQHHIQSFIYESLRETPYNALHHHKNFKFFSFSSIFPIKDEIKAGDTIKFIISSPDKFFISFLKDNIPDSIRLGNLRFSLKKIKSYEERLRNEFITSSPVILQIDKNYYYTSKRGSLELFLKRLTENALKKYNIFYKEDFSLEFIFDSLTFLRDAVVKITHWKFKKLFYPKSEIKFYRFIMDCGLGEKNSLGFGFINPIRKE